MHFWYDNGHNLLGGIGQLDIPTEDDRQIKSNLNPAFSPCCHISEPSLVVAQGPGFWMGSAIEAYAKIGDVDAIAALGEEYPPLPLYQVDMKFYFIV